MPNCRLRVVCGLGDTAAIFCPSRALTSVDLPTLGRPMIATLIAALPELGGGRAGNVGAQVLVDDDAPADASGEKIAGGLDGSGERDLRREGVEDVGREVAGEAPDPDAVAAVAAVHGTVHGGARGADRLDPGLIERAARAAPGGQRV